MASLFIVSQGLAGGETGYGKSPEFGSAAETGSDTMQSQDMATQYHGTTAKQLDNKQVREMQRILKEEGYAVGPVDGIMGPQTASALQEFQQSEGIAATGKPDEETLRALAPDAQTQEMFGLSPEFGEQDQQQWQQEEQQLDQQSTEQQRMNQQPMEPMEEEWTPEGSDSMDRY